MKSLKKPIHLGHSLDKEWEYELVDPNTINQNAIDDDQYEYVYDLPDKECIYPNDFQQRVTTKQKIILATNIAETSITIDGVTVVIDSGLCKRATFDSNSGVTRLKTQKISQASATQRTGRAGRTAPGVCYRLWSQDQQQSLAPFEIPEIHSADLSHLVLNLLLWGTTDFSELKWMDSPRSSQIDQALKQLISIGAINKKPPITGLSHHGELMSALAMPVRLAHLCVTARSLNLTNLGCDLAALLSENDPLKSSQSDILLRLKALTKPHQYATAQWSRIREQSKIYKQQLKTLKTTQQAHSNTDLSKCELVDNVALLIASTWPEHIAQQRSQEVATYKLANGREAKLNTNDHLQQSPYLAIANCAGREGKKFEQIYSACPINISLIKQYLPHLIQHQNTLEWDKKRERIRSEQQVCIEKIVVSTAQSTAIDLLQKRLLILQLIKEKGLGLLDWNKNLLAMRSRISFLYSINDHERHLSPWPNLTDSALLASLDNWFAPFLSDSFVKSFTQLSHLKTIDLNSAISNLLPWPLPQQLEALAPISFKVPSGSNIRIDYSQSPPILAVKLQEMFGCTTTPIIAKSKTCAGIALQIHLLSPAGKPLQITQDLANFWHDGYTHVKKEMKGKYPRHPWPDDPLNFIARPKTKRKLAADNDTTQLN